MFGASEKIVCFYTMTMTITTITTTRQRYLLIRILNTFHTDTHSMSFEKKEGLKFSI